MAGDVGDGYRGLDGCLSKEVQAELGIWAVPLKQCVWVIWGLKDGAYALIILQVCLGFLNMRGAVKELLAVNLNHDGDESARAGALNSRRLQEPNACRAGRHLRIWYGERGLCACLLMR